MSSHSSHTCSPSQNIQTKIEETQPLSNNGSFSDNWLMDTKKPTMFVDSPSLDSLRSSLDLEADHSARVSKCTDRSSFHFDLQGFGSADMSVADHMIHNGSLVPLNLINQQNNENENNVIPEDSVLIESHNPIDTLKMHRTRYGRVDQNHLIAPHSSPIYSPVNTSRASNNRSVMRAIKHKLNCFEGSGKPSKRIVMRKYWKTLLHFCKKVKKFGMMVRRVSPRACDDAAFRTKSGCSSPFPRASNDGALIRTRSGCSSTFSRASSINDTAFRMNSGCSSPLYDAGRDIAIREAILFCKTSSRKYSVNL